MPPVSNRPPIREVEIEPVRNHAIIEVNEDEIKTIAEDDGMEPPKKKLSTLR